MNGDVFDFYQTDKSDYAEFRLNMTDEIAIESQGLLTYKYT